ncbi:MAG: hypothetical protein GY750_00005 [Lentisphaerae bacterium]|nr:hypothetical protein [Lentisphaerota bacterium]MCP4099802.1 hypothetical protein [Lentisphaerota bacterium]
MGAEKVKSSKKHLRFWLKLLFWVILLAAVTLTCLIYWLPQYVQSRILPQIGESYGLPNLRANMRRVGICGTDIGRLKLANGAVIIDSVRLDYQLWPLLTRKTLHIKRLVINGIKIKCVLKNGKPELENFDFAKFKQALAAGKKSSGEKTQPSVYKFIIDSAAAGGLLLIRNRSDIYSVNFSSKAKPDSSFKQAKFHFNTSIGSSKTELAGTINLKKSKVNFELKQKANLREAGYMLRLKNLDNLNGDYRSDIKAEIAWKPFVIKYIKGNLVTSNFAFVKNGQKVWAKQLQMKLSGKENVVDYTVNGLRFSGTAEAGITPVTGKVRLLNSGVSFGCSIPLEITSLEKLKLKLSDPVKSSCQLQGQYAKGNWKLKSVLNANAFSANLPFGSLQFGALDVVLEADRKASKPAGTVAAINGKTGPIAFIHKLAKVTVPELELKACMGNKRVEGHIGFKGAQVDCDKFKFKLDKISMLCPLSFPGKLPVASVKCQSISWDGLQLGNAAGKIKTGIPRSDYDVVINIKPFAGMLVNLSGALITGAKPGFELKAVLPKYQITSIEGLSQKFKDLNNAKFSAGCQGLAEMKVSGAAISSSGKFELDNGTFSDEEKGLSADGIHLSLQLADLLKLRSLPDQKLTFSKFEAGKVVFTDGEVDFQIESPKSYLLEKSSFGWCGGHIYTHAMRIAAGTKTYKAIVYCDGIVLSQLVDELGLSKAVGSGTVLGRIPVRLDEKGLTFENGYLYSVPGRGNKIKLLETDALMKNIPENTREFTQLDLAGEALKDFDYQWVKLYLNTAGDKLNIKMQLDGKPAEALPFKYDNKKNMFVRIKGKGARFQGIRLDVNTSLPLNRLMLISNKLKKIMGGTKTK